VTGKSTKDKKLILVPNSLVNELMLIANKQGKPFYSFVTETLEHALKVYTDGHSLEEVVDFYEIMEIFKSLGTKMISDDMFNYLTGKESEADENVLLEKAYTFGQRCGKTIASKYLDPVGLLKDFLAATSRNLNDIAVSKEKERVKIICASPLLSKENTMLLFKFVDGTMHGLGYATQKQDCSKGVLSLEYSKT